MHDFELVKGGSHLARLLVKRDHVDIVDLPLSQHLPSTVQNRREKPGPNFSTINIIQSMRDPDECCGDEEARCLFVRFLSAHFGELTMQNY
jgi:hypothetical protein